MSLDLVRRLVKGSYLTPEDNDANLDALEAACFSGDVRVIHTVEDLPDPVGDQSTLPGKVVLLTADLDLGTDAVRLSAGTTLVGLPGQTIMSSNPNGVLRATNLANHIVLQRFNILATAGPALDLVGDIDYQLNATFVGLLGASAGTITGFDVQALKDCFVKAADGLRIDGTTNKLFLSQCPFYDVGAGNAAVTLASTLVARRIDMVNNFFKSDPASNALRAEAGYTLTLGRLKDSMREGPTQMLDGLGPDDPNWWMKENDGIQNSRVAAQSHLTGPDTTPIAQAGVFVDVVGTFSLAEQSQRFELVGNKLKYTGFTPVLVTMVAPVSVDPGNNDKVAFRAALNGVDMPESQTLIEQGAGPGSSPRTGTVGAVVEMQTDDLLGLQVANLDAAVGVPWLAANYIVVAG